MRYAELHSIWGPLKGLSAADMGRAYAERAEALLFERAKTPEFYSEVGRIDRDFTSVRIGCSKAALRQNPAIRGLIKRLEELDAQIYDQRPRGEEENRPDNVIDFDRRGASVRAAMRSKYVGGRIVIVDVGFDGGMIKRQVPTLLWPGHMDIEVSDWMRSLALAGTKLSTMLDLLKRVRPFVRFRRQRNLLWDEITDNHIRQYRDMVLARGVQVRHVNRIVSAIFAFYRWAEETLRLDYHVQLFDVVEYDRELRHHRFAITSRKIIRKSGEVSRVSKLILPDSPRNYRMRHTPTASEIERLHEAEYDSVHGERNSLIYSWCEFTGARRFEVLQVSLRHLPTREQLDRIYDGSLEWSVTVIRKGGRKGRLKPSADLLRRTLDFIERERAEIVADCIRRGKTISKFLFITSAGRPLSLSTLSDLSRAAFRKAGIKRASLHRLRAVCAHKEVIAALDAVAEGGTDVGPESLWKEVILMRVADLLDHRSLKTLQFYLNDVIYSRMQKSPAMKRHEVEAALAEVKRTADAMERRLRKFATVHEFVSTLKLRNPTPSGLAVLDDVRLNIEKFLGSSTSSLAGEIPADDLEMV